MARKNKKEVPSYNYSKQEANGSIGLSSAAQKALNSGNYGDFSGKERKVSSMKSSDQTYVANPVPSLIGMGNDKDVWKSNFSTKNSTSVIPNTPQDDQYLVKRNRYDALMKNSDLANDIKTLAQVNYNNANQDATVSQEWADEYGAKKITGGYSKSEYLDNLAKKYNLSKAELNDMALTFHSDAYKKENEQYRQDLEKAGQKHSILGSLGSFIGTLGSGIEGAYNTAVGAITGDDRYLSNIYSNTKSGLREGAKQNIKSNIGKGAYDVAMGVGDMAVGAAAGSAPAILAGNTANDAMSSALSRGSGVRKAAVYGAGAGTLDYFLNKKGLDKAKSLAVSSIKGTGVAKALAKTGVAGLGEAGENVIQDLGQSYLDHILNSENSELRLSYNNKIRSGMSDEEAFKETAKEYAAQVGLSAGIGFGMGSAMQAGSSILGRKSNVPELTNTVNTEKTKAAVPEVSALDPYRVPEGWTTDDLEKATRDISNVAKPVDATPSIHNADGRLLDAVKVPEYTADSNVFFEGTDADISLAEAQDKAITDTFKNIVTDPEFNALSFKNGKQEVFVSPSTSGNGYRVSYTIDGVPTGHHDYSVGEMDALSQNLRDLAGNGGQDIKIQRKSDISRTQGTAPVEVDPENVIYHSGKLSRLNKADTAGKMEGSRDTGYFGTGHYFVDQASRGEIGKGTSYGNKPYSSVDISKYDNLMRVDTDAKANKLHDFSQKMMRYVNGFNDKYYSEDGKIVPEKMKEYIDEMYSSYKELFGDKAMSREDFEARINDFRNGYDHDLYDRGDSAFTTFMKEHGYNGVDSRGTRSAGTERGVVIYDLDEDSILQSNVTDAEAKQGLMNTKVRNGSPLFDEELDNEITQKIKTQETQKAIRDEYRSLYDETRLKSLQDAMDQAQENVNRIKNDTIAYYERILNDDDYVREQSEQLNKEFEQFGLPGEDIDTLIKEKRETAAEGIKEARAELVEAQKALEDLKKGYDAEEAKSVEAYKQAKANVEGREAQPEATPEQPKTVDVTARQAEVKQALKDHRKAIKEQYQKYKEATNKKTRSAEYKKYQDMQKKTPRMERELRNLERQANGLMPMSDKSLDVINAYKEDLRKVGNMYAGENGKALAKDAMNALDKFEKTGVSSDYWDFVQKVIALKEASTESYTSKDGNTSTYETWHSKEDGGDLVDAIMPPETKEQKPSMMWTAIGEALKKAETETPARMNESAGLENPKITAVPEVVETPRVPSEPVPDLTEGGKVSETYTNTGKNGGGWSEEEYNKYTDPDMYRYETIDEVESVERASQMRAEEGREAFKQRVMNKDRVSSVELDGLMMEWGDTVEEARNRELAGEDASALWDESNRIFRTIQKQSTSNAQALQALAKWSRNTPEGMLMHAENVINGKTKVEKSGLQKMIDKFNKKGKDFEFSAEFAKEFLQKAEDLRNLRGDQLETREAKERMAELGRMINSQRPSGLSEKVMSFLMDNMLGNFRTLITRNAGGNVGLNVVEQIAQRPLAALIDKGVSLKTGKRTQAGLTKAGLAEYVQGFTKGIKEELADYKKDLHTSRSGENTIENAISSNRHVFKEKGVMDKLDKMVKHGLSVGDRPFYEAVYNQTLGDYNRLRSQGVMGDVVQGLTDAQFDEYAKTAAKLNALSAVYQQDSTLSKALLEFKGAVGDLSKGVLGVDVLSQFSMPFVKTPANVIERAIDYSPLGFVRNTARTIKERNTGTFDQNRFANETARNILGTALMGGAAAAANAGVLGGSYSDDKDEKQAQVESGMQEYALNLPGNKQMDISWIPVVGSNSVASAAAVDAIKKGEGGFGENVLSGLKAGGQALFDQSMFQGLQRLFGTGETYNSDEGIVGNMANVVKQGFGQAIPSLVRQGAQVLDPYQRDVANSNEGLSFAGMDNYDINSLIKNLPELREGLLAPKVNTSGDLMMENQGRGFGSKVLEDMILPGKITEIQSNALAQEAARISALTNESKAYMPKAQRKYVDTEAHTLSNDEWVNYQQRYYKELNQAGEAILKSDIYKNADPTVQQDTLDKAYSAIRSAINSEYNGKELSGAAKRYVEAGRGTKGVQAVVQYYEDKIKADELGMTVDKYRKLENENPGGAVEYKQAENLALDNGFVMKNGNANVDAYNKAVDIVGNSPQAISAYQDFKNQNFSYMDDKVPYVMNNSNFSDDQKGMMITGYTDPSQLKGVGVTGAYDTEGWEGVYYWYLMKYLADNEFGDGNGSVKKAEKNALLNSDNPYVTSLSDEMYYYLAGLPNKAW